MLCQHLMDITKQQTDSTPFRSKLNNMKLNPQMVQRLYTEIVEKLNQYDKNYYRDLESNIASLFIESDFSKMPNDDISFNFTLGMTLNKQFKEKKENEDVSQSQ